MTEPGATFPPRVMVKTRSYRSGGVAARLAVYTVNGTLCKTPAHTLHENTAARSSGIVERFIRDPCGSWVLFYFQHWLNNV